MYKCFHYCYCLLIFLQYKHTYKFNILFLLHICNINDICWNCCIFIFWCMPLTQSLTTLFFYKMYFSHESVTLFQVLQNRKRKQCKEAEMLRQTDRRTDRRTDRKSFCRSVERTDICLNHKQTPCMLKYIVSKIIFFL